MTFKLQPEPTFEMSVDIRKPGGKIEPLNLRMKFLDDKQLKAYSQEHSGKPAVMSTPTDGSEPVELEPAVPATEDGLFVGNLIVGWDADVPYSVEEFVRFCTFYRLSGRRIYKKYVEELMGVEAGN